MRKIYLLKVPNLVESNLNLMNAMVSVLAMSRYTALYYEYTVYTLHHYLLTMVACIVPT